MIKTIRTLIILLVFICSIYRAQAVIVSKKLRDIYELVEKTIAV